MADAASKHRDAAVKAWTKGHYEKALEAYKKLVNLEPANMMHRIRIGDCLAKLGRTADAIKVYKEVAAKFAADGMLIRAISVNKLILQLDPNEKETQKTLAALYSKRGVATVAQKAKAAARAGATKEAVVEAVKEPQQAAPDVIIPAAGTPMFELSEEDAASNIELADPTESKPGVTEDQLHAGGEREIDPSQPVQAEAPVVQGQEVPPEPNWVPPKLDPVQAPNPAQASAGMVHAEAELPELQISVDDAVVDEIVGAAVEEAKASLSESMGSSDMDMDELFADMGELPDVPATPLFSELEPDQFEKVIEMLMPIRLPEGTAVCREGERAASMYVIAFGRVKVTTVDPKGKKIILAELADGDFFGEAALFEGGVRKATVETIEETELLELSKESFDEVVAAFPAVAGVLRMFYYSRMADTYLAKSPLFQALTREERWAIVGSMTLQRFPAGYPIIKEGETGDALFLIRNGAVRVFSGDGGETVVLGNLGAGDIFGEIAVVNLQPRTATVVATHDTECFRLDREAARRVLAMNPQIGNKIKEIAEDRIRNTIDAMISSSAGTE